MVTIPFIKGDVVFAKNGGGCITFFDGRREVITPKMASKNIRFLSRLNQRDTNLIEWDYQLKKSAKINHERKLAAGEEKAGARLLFEKGKFL